MKRSRALTALVVAALLQPVAATRSSAFSVTKPCGDVRSPVVGFLVYESNPKWDTVPTGWTETPREVVEIGFSMWEEARHRNGSLIASMAPYAGSGRYVYVVLAELPEGTHGLYDCADNTILLNTDELQHSQLLFRNIAAHEMGHAITYSHTGMLDSLLPGEGRYPLMSTCLDGSPSVTENRNYTNDDDAVTTYFHAMGSAATYSANYGFENGLDHYTPSAGTAVSVGAGGTSGGAFHALVLPNSSSDSLRQSVNAVTAAGRRVRTSMQYVTPGATGGGVRLQLWWRSVTYGIDASPCSWPSGRDQNVRLTATDDTGWQLAADTLALPASSTWRIGATPYATIPSVTNGGVDLRLRVYSSASSGGGYVHAHYDDLRLEEG